MMPARYARPLLSDMALDTRTLFVVLMVTFGIFGLLQLLMWAQRRSEGAFLLWGCANLSSALAGLLTSLRDLIPHALSVIANNVMAVLGYMLMWAGLRWFARQPIRWSAVIAVPLSIGVLFAAYPPVGDSLPARICFFHLYIGLISAACFLDAHRAQRDERLIMRWTAMVAFVIAIGFVSLRILLTLTDPDLPGGYLEPSARQSRFTLASVIIVMLWNLSILLMANERLVARLLDVAHDDALTGVLNRAGFRPLAERQIGRCAQEGRAVSVLLMDLDRFKRINDVHGHDAGDALLRRFVEVARAVVRPHDLLARYGGEEFCALLPGAGLVEATQVAERIRAHFEAAATPGGQTAVGTTVSIGVAQLQLPAETLGDAIGRADRALYAAKHAGRNRVLTASAEGAGAALPVAG